MVTIYDLFIYGAIFRLPHKIATIMEHALFSVFSLLGILSLDWNF